MAGNQTLLVLASRQFRVGCIFISVLQLEVRLCPDRTPSLGHVIGDMKRHENNETHLNFDLLMDESALSSIDPTPVEEGEAGLMDNTRKRNQIAGEAYTS